MTELLRAHLTEKIYRHYLNDPNYRGEKTPDEVAEGPLEQRGCTDLLCYIIFIICWVTSVFVAIDSLAKGNPGLAFRPSDPSNNTCGLDPGYIDYPYIYFANPQNLTHTVCVSSCPSWGENETTPTELDCKPNFKVPSCSSDDIKIYQSYQFAGIMCLPRYNSTLIQEINHIVQLTNWQQSVSDLAVAKWMFISAPVFALVLGFFWVFLLRYCAGPMTWVLILLYFAALIGGGYYSFKMATDPEHYSIDIAYLDLLQPSSRMLKFIAFASWTAAAISLILLICYFRRIELAIAVIKCASEFIQDLPQILIIPPIFFIINVLFFTYWAVVAVHIWSTGNIVYNKQGYPFKTIQHSQLTSLCGAFHIWHGFWNFFFLMAVPQFIIASTTCYWYYEEGIEQNLDSPIIKSFWRGTVLHGGSIALGSAVLAIIAVIRVIMEYVHQQLKEFSDTDYDSGLIRGISAYVTCCLDCFERFVRFLNQHAYVQIAMTGNSFCKAAEDAFFLNLRNFMRLGAVHGLGRLFTFTGNVFITAIVSIFSYSMFTRITFYQTNLFDPVVPTLFAAAIAFVVSSNFMSIFGVSADTIIHIFCMDEETHTFGAKHAPPQLKEFIEDHFGQKVQAQEMRTYPY